MNDNDIIDNTLEDVLQPLKEFLKQIPTLKPSPKVEKEEKQELKGKVIVLASPSGGGKSTLVRKLLYDEGTSKYNLKYGISYTTRNPRAGEINGLHYEFVSKASFLEGVRNGFFLEWDESSPGNYYGTSRAQINKVLKSFNYITEINTTGAKTIKAIYGDDCITIFLIPPSLDVLKERLEKRGTEAQEEIRGRLSKAVEELDEVDYFDHVIINSNIEQTFKEIKELLNNFLEINKDESI